MSTHNSPTRKIVFQYGARLEAMDFTHIWYPAKICRVNEKERKALIHFEGWNHRYDEWISFDSDSLRPLSRGQSKDESKEEREKEKEKDWKLGDRVLARWQDCKFYPAKITKVNTDGTYEVLFYDGFKKTVQRINVKPDHKVTASHPSGSEREKEVQDKQSRKAALANARAERARKRSKELEELKAKGIVQPSATVTRRRIKRPRLNDKEEFGAASESSVSSPAEIPEVEEVMREYDLMENEEGKSSDGVSSSTSSPEKAQSAVNIGGDKDNTRAFAGGKVDGKDAEKPTSKSNDARKHYKSALQDTEAVRTDDVEGLSPEKNQEPELRDQVFEDDKTWVTTPESNEQLAGSKPTKEVVGSTAIVSYAESERGDAVQTVATDIHDNGSEISMDATSELQTELVEQQQVGSAPQQTSNESRASVAGSLEGTKAGTAVETARGSVVTPSVLKNRMSPRPVKGRPRLRVVPRSGHRARGRGSSLGTRGRRNKQYSTKNPSRTSISPRGYGYSMAVMLPEKKDEETASAGPEKKTETNNNQVSTADTMDAASDVSSLTKPKTNTFQAKKKRLDQITGKLSAQRQSEADAALVSPSAFQPTPTGRHTSSPQPPPHHQVSPNPQQHNLPPPPPLPSSSPLPVESFPPPLIYSPPMTAPCCTNPHCRQHAAVYPPPPARGPLPHAVHHVGPSHIHPRHEYPPGTSQATYLMYSGGPRGPPGPSYNGRPCLASCPVYSHIHEALPPTHESALARLIQCEQRMGYTSLPPRYRDGHYHGQWVGQPYMTLPQHEERWRPPLEITDRTSPPPAHLLPHQSLAQLQSHHLPVSQSHSHPHQPPVTQAHSIPSPVSQSHPHLPPVSKIHPHPPQMTQTHTSSPVKQTHTSPVVQSHPRVTRPQIPTEEALASPSPPVILPGSLQAGPQPQTGTAGPLPDVSSASENPNNKQQNKRLRKSERPLPTGFRTLECGAESFETTATESSMTVKGKDKEDITEEEKLKGPQLSSPVVREVKLATDSSTDVKHVPTACLAKESLPVAMKTNTATELPITVAGAELDTTAASYLGKPRRSKDILGPAPKELVIEIDHNKFKCKVSGCDKSFRKASGLDYHMKYYHRPDDKPLKRKRSSASARLDNVTDSSPEAPTYQITKRRCHRSSAPGQLSSWSESVFEALPTAAVDESGVVEESVSTPMEISSPTELKLEPEVEIEPGTEVEPLELGSLMDSIELEEEEDEDEDVIRCLCNDAEDNGFMIQCEQCLTWQHSECVGLSEYTVPPRYLCYVCSNAKGLRKSAKHRNDFDWFKKGTLATFPLLSIEHPEYNAVMCKSTHDLMSDVHSVNNVLRSLRFKINILKNPNDPELEKWKYPVNNEAVEDESQAIVEETGLSDDVERSTVVKPPCSAATPAPILDPTPGPRLEHVANGSLLVRCENGLSPVYSSVPPCTSNGKSTSPSRNLAVNGVAGEGTDERESCEGQEVLGNTDSSREIVNEPMSPVPALVPVGGVPYEESANSTALARSDATKSVTERERSISRTEAQPERTISSNNTGTPGASDKQSERTVSFKSSSPPGAGETQPERTMPSNSTGIPGASETQPERTMSSNITGTPGVSGTQPERTVSNRTGIPSASETQPEITISNRTGIPGASETQPERTISSNITGSPGVNGTQQERTVSNRTGTPGASETQPERTISSNITGSPGVSGTQPERTVSNRTGTPGVSGTQPERTISNRTGMPGASGTRPEITISSNSTGTPGVSGTQPERTVSNRTGTPGVSGTQPERTISNRTGMPGASGTRPEITISSNSTGIPGASETQPDRTISSNITGTPGACPLEKNCPAELGHPSNSGSSSSEAHSRISMEQTRALLPPAHNLLDDICQLQNDMEARLDEIERQLEVLENAVDEPGTSSRKKPDLRKLVKDLTRVKLLALNAV